MSFDWLDYLDVADELAGFRSVPANSEAKLRSAVSRAYYGAFCKARNRLRDVDGVSLTGTGKDHQLVQEEFEASGDANRQSIGVSLRRLRQQRNLVDYDDVITGSLPTKVRFSLKLALSITQDLRKL